MKSIKIGEVLKEFGYVTEEQIGRALEEQKSSDTKRRLGHILVDLGFVTEKQVIEAMARKLGYPIVDLDTVQVDTDAVAVIPRAIAEQNELIAFGRADGKLRVAMSDPLNFYITEEVRQIAGCPLDIALCEAGKIRSAISYHYAEAEAKSQIAETAKTAVSVPAPDQLDLEVDESDAGVVKLLSTMINQGFASGASDIHLEPQEDKTLLRTRVDGVLLERASLPRTVHPSLIARIKIISGLDIAERRLPQDGHFRTRIGGEDVNVRVSVIPTVYGEKAVMRFLSNNNRIDNAGQFGMSEDNFRIMEGILKAPHGIVYITGPTGSGKTTTLYMMLQRFADGPCNISTIEDPVERNLARVNQMQVNNVSGLTFEAGLRSLLRQDPDIIMVGETRDNETAQTSVRAAITGHLVFSTLHTNNAVSSIVRLEDMGVPDYLVSSSVVGIVAQRLMRKVCPYCREEYEPDDAERAMMPAGTGKLTRGKGCNYCNHTGYKGRIAVHEILTIDREMRRMISSGATVDEMTDYARAHLGLVTLREAAQKLVAAGTTTVEELVKVAYGVD